MPTQGRPRSSILDHATREQLDELDALLQRMLALPVDSPEDDGGAPPEPSNSIQAAQTKVKDEPASTKAGSPSPNVALVPAPVPKVQAKLEHSAERRAPALRVAW